jgi:hypothetical protein
MHYPPRQHHQLPGVMGQLQHQQSVPPFHQTQLPMQQQPHHQRQLPQHPPLQPLGRTPVTSHPTLDQQNVTVKHILTTESSRAKSSIGQYGPSRSVEYALPTPGPLERQWSHPNLYQKAQPPRTAGRQLPKTPQHPPGTIIVIENVLPDQSSLPRPRRGGLGGARGRGAGSQATKSKTPGPGGTGFSYHEQLRANSLASRGRSSSLPRRAPRRSRSGCRLPALPPIARSQEAAATKSAIVTAAVTAAGVKPPKKAIAAPTIPGTGRRLPRTPQQSAIQLHHTPHAAPRDGIHQYFYNFSIFFLSFF